MYKVPGLLLIGNRFISPKKLEQDKYYRLLTHLFYKDSVFHYQYPKINVYNSLCEIKKDSIRYYKTINKLRNNYKEFLDLLVDDFYYLGKTNEYIPQGICMVGDDILVSMYDSETKKKSKIKASNKEVLLNIPIGAHVGGITYDSKNNLVWIANTGGKISSFDYEELVSSKEISPKYTFQTSNSVSSFISYYDNCIYVGEFNKSSNGRVVSYRVNEDGTIGKELDSFSVPSKTQGISFYKKDGITYMALSRSYGRNSNSILELYNYDTLTLLNSFKMPPMMEQISFDIMGNLLVIFENNADKYRYTGKVQIPSICKLRVI